ncbi:MAG: tetratricopeptide repeat protein [Planctomycetota bacterium]|nr:tetratricopeptide repeat protein [Planctomycetota bacterium]
MNLRYITMIASVAAAAAIVVSLVYADNGDANQQVYNHLSDKDPAVRKAAVLLIEREGKASGVKRLVELIESEEDPTVLAASFQALRKLTSESLGDDPAKWLEWWKTTGSASFPPGDGSDIAPLPEYWNISVVVTIIAILVLVLFMLVFGFMGGYRLKQLKEIMRRAETYVQSAETMSKSSGGLLAELERKKSEIMQFITNLKDENEAEIERFSELLEQNVHHRMREATMSLREKAEKELAQTLVGLKEGVEVDVRRSVGEHTDKGVNELVTRQATFLADLEAHTLFIEGSFYFINNKLEEAMKCYRKLLHLKPGHYVAWNNMGTILRQMMRFDESLEAYSKALEISPNNAGVLYNVAGVHALQRRRDKMIECLRNAVHIDPELKDEALNDQVFKEYWADQEFKDLAEG